MTAHPGGLYAAAGPALRAAIGSDWRGRVVRIWNGPLHVDVTLADWCACGSGHLIDLYSDAMSVINPSYLRNGGALVIVRW